jgi:hypothetical protein
MKRKTRLCNFRLEWDLHEELLKTSRSTEIPSSMIVRKGLRLILERMKSEGSIWTSSLQGAHP